MYDKLRDELEDSSQRALDARQCGTHAHVKETEIKGPRAAVTVQSARACMPNVCLLPVAQRGRGT